MRALPVSAASLRRHAITSRHLPVQTHKLPSTTIVQKWGIVNDNSPLLIQFLRLFLRNYFQYPPNRISRYPVARMMDMIIMGAPTFRNCMKVMG